MANRAAINSAALNASSAGGQLYGETAWESAGVAPPILSAKVSKTSFGGLPVLLGTGITPLSGIPVAQLHASAVPFPNPRYAPAAVLGMVPHFKKFMFAEWPGIYDVKTSVLSPTPDPTRAATTNWIAGSGAIPPIKWLSIAATVSWTTTTNAGSKLTAYFPASKHHRAFISGTTVFSVGDLDPTDNLISVNRAVTTDWKAGANNMRPSYSVGNEDAGGVDWSITNTFVTVDSLTKLDTSIGRFIGTGNTLKITAFKTQFAAPKTGEDIPPGGGWALRLVLPYRDIGTAFIKQYGDLSNLTLTNTLDLGNPRVDIGVMPFPLSISNLRIAQAAILVQKISTAKFKISDNLTSVIGGAFVQRTGKLIPQVASLSTVIPGVVKVIAVPKELKGNLAGRFLAQKTQFIYSDPEADLGVITFPAILSKEPAPPNRQFVVIVQNRGFKLNSSTRDFEVAA
jgi:hypothetical protein